MIEATLRAFEGADPAICSLEPNLRVILREASKRDSKLEDRKLVAQAWLNCLTPRHPESESRALLELNDGTVTLAWFADHAQRLEFQSDDSLKALLDGAKTLDKPDAAICGKAFLKLASDRISAIGHVANLPNLGRSWLIQVVSELRWDNPELIPGALNAMHAKMGTHLRGSNSRQHRCQSFENASRNHQAI